MIVTVLWEDSRGRQRKGFGPHELLVACLVDRLVGGGATNWARRQELRRFVEDRISPRPKKGVGQLRKALEREGEKLANDGPLFAVLDSDRIRERWRQDPPADCPPAIAQRIREEISGTYALAILVRNVESLVEAACRATGAPVPSGKPRPDERDRLLDRAVWFAGPTERAAILLDCPSFGRLMARVARVLPPP